MDNMDGNEAEQQKLQLKREQLAEQEEDLQDKCDEQKEPNSFNGILTKLAI